MLTRKLRRPADDEHIVIDLSGVDGRRLDDPLIRVSVVELRNDKARIGVEAPAEIPVHRNEIYEAIKRDERAARKKEETALI